MNQNIRLVRNVLTVLGGLIPLLAGCGGIHWEHDYTKGLRRAAQLRKRVLVQFHSNVNADCMEMEQKVFNNSEVKELITEYVAIRLDYYLNKQLADDLNVQVLPTFFVLRSDGAIIGSHGGKMDKEKFRYFLIKNRYR
ncbi:MAG: thioredoxin family protein [Planctomycetota bacterium]|nr:MAG: thioredoxin family protein [Planctomycetota bacterium]